MPTVKCPCGFDSGIPTPPGSQAIGEMTKTLNMAWVLLMDGNSVWICRTCEKLVNEAAMRISNILGSRHWTSTMVLPRDPKKWKAFS
jgi:hypothetical protein